MGKFNFNESPVKKVAEEILDSKEPINGYGMTEADAEQFVSGGQQQGRGEQPASRPVESAAQPASPANQQMQQQPQAPSIVKKEDLMAIPFGGPLVYNEATKGISVKLPYSLYDALDAIKKQTQRTGNPRDKMGIGDLVVLAVKEFVERNRVG